MNTQQEFDFGMNGTPTVGEPSLADKVRVCLDQLDKFRLDIERALGYAQGSHTYDDVVRMVLAETVHFYPLDNSFIIMEIHNFPQHKNYHGFLAGGHWEEIMAFQPEMLKIAKGFGCKHLSISGRPGWTKVMKSYGWQHQYSTVYRKVE